MTPLALPQPGMVGAHTITRAVVLEGLCRLRAMPVVQLHAEIARLLDQVDPAHQRDKRSLWELSGRERARKPDIFDRVRYAGDELAAVSTRLAACLPSARGTAGTADMYVVAVTAFASIITREERPLSQLEHAMPMIRVQYRSLGDDLEGFSSALHSVRNQHKRAVDALELLATLDP